MITKTPAEIKLLEKACRIAAQVLEGTGKFIRAGISTNELDEIANDLTLSKESVSACIGYHGYPKSTCISVNEVICHGVPSDRILKEGDIVNIDITVIKDGFHGDTSATFFVGTPTDATRRLVDCAFEARQKGIDAIRAGGTTGDIGFAVNKHVTRTGFYAVKDIGGHGIGRGFHEEPFVPSFGRKGKGDTLKLWGAITVEPMVNVTSTDIDETAIEGSSVIIYTTADNTWSAQFEHTVLITETGPEILTFS